MRAKVKNIILFCDDKQESSLLKEQLEGIQQSTLIDVTSTFKDLLSLLKKKIPDVIVLHLKKTRKNDITYLKSLRKENGVDEIPIFIYRSKPGQQDFHDLLIKISKTL